MGGVPRGVVECGHRQDLARALLHKGPLTARGLARETKRSTAWARYNLRILSATGAVTPSLAGIAKGDELAYALTADNLPAPEQEILLGELSFQTCGRLMAHLLVDGPVSMTELSERTGLCRREAARYLRVLCPRRQVDDAPRVAPGNEADRLRDLPEWYVRWLDATAEEDQGHQAEEDS